MAKHKLLEGNPLVILGIEITLTSVGASFRPSPDKVDKWVKQMKESIAAGRLTPGAASKLAGQLQWASQAIFRRLGRALLGPIIQQSHGNIHVRSTAADPEEA